MLDLTGFEGGRILEPAAGCGVFIGNMPKAVFDNSIIEAIEMDLLTSRILLGQYSQIELITTGFENIYFGKKNMT